MEQESRHIGFNPQPAPSGPVLDIHQHSSAPFSSTSGHQNRAKIRTRVPVAGREPRSRRNRPCDHCRRAKSRCNIGPSGPPCTHCRETDRECTFEVAAAPRQRRVVVDDSTDYDHTRSTFSPSVRRRSSSIRGSSSPGRSRSPSPRPYANSSAMRSVITKQHAPIRPISVASFDHLAKSDRFDAHVLTVVLTDDLLPIANELEGEESENAHVRQISQDPSRPIFVVMDPKPDDTRRPVAGAIALSHITALLHHHPLHLSPSQLYKQYCNQVDCAIPILPQGAIESQPPMLQAAILAASLSHQKSTRELAPVVSGMLNISTAGLGEHNLAGIAAAVLEMGMRGANSSRASYLLMAKTISLAQLLGMHIDPRKWAIPRWEQQLRIRLWWMLVTHDAWMSFLNSRPAHIQAHNWSTPFPELSAILEAGCAHTAASSDSSKAFVTMCRLGEIVTKLQRHCCTLSSGRRSVEERKLELVALYREANELLLEWRDHANGSRLRPPGIPSLLVHLLGLRCMLTRIRLELEHGLGAAFEPLAENFAPFTELIDFVSLLQEADVDGFWLNYAGHVLSSVTSSLIRFAMAPTDRLNSTALSLITRLLRSLNRLQTDFSWDIAAPALRRAASMAARLKSIGEHDDLVNALQGTETTPIARMHPHVAPLPDPFDFGGGTEDFGQMLELDPQLNAAWSQEWPPEWTAMLGDGVFTNGGISL